jgi:hypothetical protein
MPKGLPEQSYLPSTLVMLWRAVPGTTIAGFIARGTIGHAGRYSRERGGVARRLRRRLVRRVVGKERPGDTQNKSNREEEPKQKFQIPHETSPWHRGDVGF